MDRRPRVGITLGDPAGIGPEILARLLVHERLGDLCTPVVVGDARALRRALEQIGAPAGFDLAGAAGAELVDLDNIAPADYELGQVSAAAGRAAGEYIERAVTLALDRRLDAVVTNPIHKEAFRLGGWGERFAGHTEMLAALTGAPSYCMMLACGSLRVCHVTTHVSLLQALTRDIRAPRILEVIALAHQAGRQLGVAAPRIGVAAINPHGGEGGAFGDEERREIAPAIGQARERGIDVEGPVPADTLFCKASGGMYDLVVAMYHDQGHIPVKLAGFVYDHQSGRWSMRGVNVTLGLPIIRTSVDHGTAFDRVGRNISDHHSLLEAVRLACSLVGQRRDGGHGDAAGGPRPCSGSPR